MNFARQAWDMLGNLDSYVRHLDQGGISFPIPDNPGYVSYVLTREFFPVNFRVLTMKFRITGSAGVTFSDDVREVDGGTTPPSVRFLLYRNHNLGRWWSVEGVPLALGTHRLSVDLSPENWGGVYGNNGAKNNAFTKFAKGQNKIGVRVGFSFGGGFDYGHGVRVSKGHAKFHLVEMHGS